MQTTLGDFNIVKSKNGISETPNIVKQKLIETFNKWLEKHRTLIGYNWYRTLKNELKKSKKNAPTIPNVCGLAMWIFQGLGNLGVVASIGIDGFQIYGFERPFNKEITEDVLYWCSKALKLTKIPKEIAKEQEWI